MSEAGAGGKDIMTVDRASRVKRGEVDGRGQARNKE